MTLADDLRDRMDTGGLSKQAAARQVVEAVLLLHVPTDERSGWVAPGEYESMSSACEQCGSQDLAVVWPCPTLVAVANALGVDPEFRSVGADT